MDKFTFEKKLGIDSSQKKWIGLKLVTIGVLLAFVGGGIAALGFNNIGKIFVILGVFGAVVGLIVHFAILIKSIIKS